MFLIFCCIEKHHVDVIYFINIFLNVKFKQIAFTMIQKLINLYAIEINFVNELRDRNANEVTLNKKMIDDFMKTILIE